jgi:hypothetical protein
VIVIVLHFEDARVTGSYADALTDMFRAAVEMAHFAGANDFDIKFEPLGWTDMMCSVPTETDAAMLRLRFPDYFVEVVS